MSYRPPLDIVRARPRPKPRRLPWPAAVAQRLRAAWLHAMGPAHRVLAWNAVLFLALVLVLGIVGLARSLDFRAKDHPDVWKGKLAHAFETHYDKRFPLKNLGVNLWAAADYELFGEGRPGVVVGRDGWLYTDEEFKLDNDSPALVVRHLALIDWVRRTLAQRHVALLVVVVPAKARVYPEHLGRRQPPALHRRLYAQALDTLHAEGVSAMGLLPVLLDGKRQQPTFLRTDTHWTPYGARQAARAIAARLSDSVDATGTFHTETLGTQVHRGDLFNFLPLDPWFGSLLPPPDQLRKVRTIADARGGLLGGTSTPAVALVGTSYSAEPQWNFAGALEQALQADVLNYAKAGEGPFTPMLAYLGSADFRVAPPKLVVWEVPERYLPLPQPTLAAYHLPPDAFAVHAATPAASGGL
ncbi:alginate O-acetyltransferase AlgX-related protein [Dyella sp. KRB-257]